MMDLVLIAHNLRSAHNVGSLLRSSEGLGVDKVYLTGYTPYPKTKDDTRLPHLAAKVSARIAKTALGAENQLDWQQSDDIFEIIARLKDDGFELVALEQTPAAEPLNDFQPSAKTALIVGREVEGIEPEVLAAAARAVEIIMHGRKESFNVAVAAAIALYQIKHKGDGHLTR